MRFTQNTKGFTLIELLVVITIIGILAVGGTATYTAQIQKARDSTRLTDLNAIRSGIEQFYQDYTEYPRNTDVAEFSASGSDTTSRTVLSYVQKIPKDSKSGQKCSKGGVTTASVGACDYIYNVSDDINGIAKGRYRVSTGFENAGNVDTKAEKDGGIEGNRFELGLQLAAAWAPNTCNRWGATTYTVPGTAVVASGMCDSGFGVGSLIVAGN